MSNRPTEPHSSMLEKWRPVGLSLLIHVLLVGFLVFLGSRAAKSLSTEPDRRGSIVLAVAPEDQPDRYLDEQDSLVDEPTEISDTPPAMAAMNTAPPELKVKEIKTPIAELAGPPPLETTSLDATSMTQANSTVPESNAFELSQEDLDLIEAEQRLLRSRAPKGEPGSVSLFGSGQMEGRSFVFLIDRSKSMGSSGLGVLGAATDRVSQSDRRPKAVSLVPNCGLP